MKDNRNQHYVPQYYLKNFSKNNLINIYDIKGKNRFSNSIRNTAFKKKYYNVNLELINNVLENESFKDVKIVDNLIRIYNENVLSNFINSFNLPAKRIENKDFLNTISIIDTHSLVDFALIQLYRNPKFFLFSKLIEDNLNVKIVDFGKTVNGIMLLLLISKLHYKKEFVFKDQILKAFEPIIREFELIKKDITNSYKIMYLNYSDENFITSDCPVGLVRHFNIDTFTLMTIPINPKILFCCFNKKAFPEFKDETSSKQILTNESIEEVYNLNISTIANATRFLYSIDGNFPLEIDDIEYKPFWNTI